jgi:Tol biopolymer transport system component
MRPKIIIIVVIFLAILGSGCQKAQVASQPTSTLLPVEVPSQTDTPLLTETPIPLYSPTPGSSQVIAYCYQSVSTNSHQIYTVDLTGNKNLKLIDAPIGLNHLDWSPDGQRLAVAGYISDTTWSIYVYEITTSGLIRLTNTDGVWDSDPSWSADGSKIAFTRTYLDSNNHNEIWMMNPDGSHQQSLGINGFASDWSPDGTRLVYISNKSGNYEIYTSAFDGTDEQQLTFTPEKSETFAIWSPDGSQIAFSASYGELGTEQNLQTYEIYTMEKDGTDVQQLTHNQAYDDHARWSPDGTMLVFESDLDQSDHSEIYLMDVDGTHLRRLTNTPADANAINPVWQPSMVTLLPPTAVVISPTPTSESKPILDPFIKSDQKLGDGQSFSIALGDLDMDGDLDALVANFQYASTVWVNNGDTQGGLQGTFSKGQNLGFPSGHGVALGDLDGDGDLDVFLVHNMNVAQVWLNDGVGDFIDSGQQLGGVDDATTSVSLVDIDNDGDLDAFTIHYQKPVRLWLNNGLGVFTAAKAEFGENALSVEAGDVDNDGDQDALIAYIEKPNQLWLNDGLGNFTDSGQRLGSEEGWGNGVMGDVDKDGDLDILLASTSAGSIWLNDGKGNFTESSQHLGNNDFITIGDIDNDTDLDAITCSEIWLNDGTGIFNIVSLHNQVNGCSGIWLADVDGDSNLDAFVSSYLSSNELWLNMTHK